MNFEPKLGYRIVNLDGDLTNNRVENLKINKNIRWREIVPRVRAGENIDELAAIYGFAKEELEKIKPKKSQKGVLAKYKEDNSDYFENIDSEDKAYWLGFLFADGSVAKDRDRISVALAEKDKFHIEKFAKEVPVELNIFEFNL